MCEAHDSVQTHSYSPPSSDFALVVITRPCGSLYSDHLSRILQMVALELSSTNLLSVSFGGLFLLVDFSSCFGFYFPASLHA